MAQVPLFLVESAYFFPVISIERGGKLLVMRAWGGGGNIQSVAARSSLSVLMLRAFLTTVRTFL
jgi:hypothetical protein